MLQDHISKTYNNLSHFLEIGFHFDFVAPSWLMLKLVVLASTKLPTTKSLTFHCGIELSTPLALGGLVNPIPNLVLSPSMLEHSKACQIGTSLRVTKCHRAANFDGVYLKDRARYGCDSCSYRTMLMRTTVTSLTFWRSDSIFILRHHLR